MSSLPVIEVLGLADITDVSRQYRRHDERIDHRRVVGGNNRRPVAGHIFKSDDCQIEHPAKHRTDDHADNRLQLIAAAGAVPVRVVVLPTHLIQGSRRLVVPPSATPE